MYWLLRHLILIFKKKSFPSHCTTGSELPSNINTIGRWTCKNISGSMTENTRKIWRIMYVAQRPSQVRSAGVSPPPLPHLSLELCYVYCDLFLLSRVLSFLLWLYSFRLKLCLFLELHTEFCFGHDRSIYICFK